MQKPAVMPIRNATSAGQSGTIRRALGALALATVATVAVTPANAQQSANLIDATNVQVLFEVAKRYGTAEMQTTKSGDPQIVGTIDGARYVLFFEGCKDNRNCKNVQFYAGWKNSQSSPTTMDRLNEWNRTKRWGKAYLDREGDPVIEMDVNLFNGVSRANFDDTFDWWKLIITEYKKFIGN